VLANEGADLSAHETLERAQHRAEDFTILAAEYETLARVAQQRRWDELLDRSGLGSDRLEQVRQSAAYGPLLAALREAESRGLDVEGTFPELVAARPLDGAEDPASVMHGRVDRWAQTAGSRRQAASNLIAGLIPRAVGVTDPDLTQALDERAQAMQCRARELAVQALERGDVWITRLGTPPTDPVTRERWMVAVSTVAAYRDRWSIGNGHRPLGSDGAAKTIEGVGYRKRAQVATRRALSLSEGGGTSSRPSAQPTATGVEPIQDRSESVAM